jgi:ApaG protein
MEQYTIYSDRSKTYALETHGHRIEVTPYFLPERSVPYAPHFFYAYRVVITNLNQDFVSRLIERCWLIRNGQGHEQEVKGPGVIGQTPLLRPRESFTYTSFCPIGTPTGSMRGFYEMEDQRDLTRFRLTIPLFFLRPDLPIFHYDENDDVTS